jgi:glycosyltransferase involved in cell wall biosynthesis
MLKDIAEWHTARGDTLTILTAAAASPTDQAKRHAWCNELGIRLVETPLRVDRGLSTVRRVINAVRYAIKMIRLLAGERFDLIFVGSYPPILPALVVRLFDRLKGSRYIYYVQDILPESIERKHSGLRALAVLLKAADTPSMKSSAATITLSDNMKCTLAKRGVNNEKIFVLPNYAIDEAHETPRKQHHHEPTIIYAGNHGKLQNLYFFLRSVQLAANRCKFRVQLMGGGSELDSLKRLTNELDLPNIDFLGLKPRDEAQTLIAKADVGFVGALPGLYDVAYPSKMMSYLKAGLPVLVQVENDSPVADFIQAHQFGIAASPTNLAEAADAIVDVVSKINDGQFDRVQIAQRAAEEFSKELFFDRYSAVLASCT